MPEPYPSISDDPTAVDQPTGDLSAQPAAQQALAAGPIPPPSPASDFIPLEPENPDSASASSLVTNYNNFKKAGGNDADLSYDELYNVMSVAKGLSTQLPENQALNSPDLYFHQVYEAGKAPVMATDVLSQAAQHPETIPSMIASGIDWTGKVAQQLIGSAVHGSMETIQDTANSINPFISQSDRDMSSARVVNGILQGFKQGITLFPNLVAGAKETIDYATIKSQLDQVTDPVQKDALEHQLSEILRAGQLRESQTNAGVQTAYKDLQGFLNLTGISAALKGTGLPDRLRMLGMDQAQPSQDQAMVLGFISDPTNLALMGVGEAAGVVKSAVRMGHFEDAVKDLNAIDRQATSLAASRASTTSAIASATDDTVKQGLQAQLNQIAAQEKQVAADRAATAARVSTLGGEVTKQMNNLSPNLFQKFGAATSGAVGAVADGLGNLVENSYKIPEAIAERVLGSGASEQAKAAMTETMSGMAKEAMNYVGVHALVHGGPVGYIGARVVKSLLEMMGNPKALRSISRNANLIGDQFALGKQTLPALQEIAAKTSGLTSAVASLLDNPLVRSIPAQFAGGMQGAAVGGALGGLASGGTMAGVGQGLLQGGVLGAAGGGHGQLRSFNSPAELRNAAIGDRARFIGTLDPAQKPTFNRLNPDTQLAISVFAHAHPDARIGFVNDPKGPNGSHYVGDDGAHITLNVAGDNPLEAVLTHEIGHHIAAHGLQDAVTDHILGNPATGHIGLFTALDADGKPTTISHTDPLSGIVTESYLPDQRFFKYQSEYNARKLRDVPGAKAEDNNGIAEELFAELSSHMFSDREKMQKLMRGVVPSDLVSTSAVTNFFSKLGLPFDAGTGGLAAHPNVVNNIKGLNDIVTEYVKGKQYKNHPLEHEDGYSRVRPDDWKTNPDVLYRNLDGAGILARDPKTGDPIKDAAGLPILQGAKAADAEHAKFTGSILDLIRANPQTVGTDIKSSWVLMKDRNGREVYRTQNVPDEIFSKLGELNQYNPFQLANWQKINGLTRRDDGSVMLANYNKAVARGGRYTTVEMKERAMVPLYSEVSPKTQQTNIQAYDPTQMMKNIVSMLKRKAAAGTWGSAADALADVHTYLENIAAGRPGETGIGLLKKQMINAMFGINTQGNPFIEQLTRQFPSVFKTFRLDRANKVREVTGVTRPVYGSTYEQVRAFMQPRQAAATPEEQAAAMGPETVPVEMRTTSTGKVEPVKHDYGITSAPLVSDKQPPKNLSANDFGHVDFLTKPDQQKLTHLNKASAVTDYADKLVEDYGKYKNEAWAGEAKNWYDHVRKQLKIAFGGDQELFAHLLAATSPQQGVVQNFKDAFEAYKQYRSGAYDDAIREYKRTGKITADMKPTKANGALFGANSDAVLKVLAGTWLDEVKGPKTPNFFENLFQRGTKATIDKWAARTMRRLGYEGVEGSPEQWRLQPKSEQGVSNLDFAFSQEAFKQTAKKVGMDPHQLQAIMWYAEKHLWAERGYSKGGAAAAKASYIPMLTEYAQHVAAHGGAKEAGYLQRLQAYTPTARIQ